ITLTRHVNPDPPLIFTGFLMQSDKSITGSLILGSKCQGVGTITGTVDGQNISLTIHEFGQEISLTGTMPVGNTPMGGQFSNLAGGCTDFANTGTWTAIPVTPMNGAFHGTFTSTEIPSNGLFDVTGTVVQGVNTGNSTATLNGRIARVGSPQFCFD